MISKKTLISGAGYGIGREIAEKFAKEKHDLYLLIKKKIPLNKFSTKSEIASIVYFLTSESAQSITGTSIISDGGWTAGK